MEQIVALPWHGPLESELLEEAAATCGKSIYVARNVVALEDHLRQLDAAPDLLIVDSGWAAGLSDSLNAALRPVVDFAVPTILTQFEKSSLTDTLGRTLNIVAIIKPTSEYTHLPQLISAFYEFVSQPHASLARYQEAVDQILSQSAEDKCFFGRALRRQEARLARCAATLS